MNLLLFMVVALTPVYGQILQKNCPPAENIKPCVCKNQPDNLASIRCGNLSNVDQLLNVLKNGMQRYTFSEMLISDSRIGKLPSNAFQGVNIKSLIIRSCTVTILGDGANHPPFLGLENSLNRLQIQGVFHNETQPLKFLSLSHLKRLKDLLLSQNVVPEIGNDWFESGPYDLKELYFSDSSTNKLGSHVFAFLTELKTLSVTGGNLNLLTRNMFPNPAPHLVSLELSHNALSALPANVFANMPSLEFVYLKSNKLTTIDELTWTLVWHQLVAIDLSRNPLNCDNNLKWVFLSRLPDILQGNCAQPLSKKEKDLEKLTVDDFS